jgi:ubiquitin C-terminal hydrolase
MILNPEKLLKIFKKRFKHFDNSQEQDAHEAILCVIDILEKARPEIKDSIYGSIQKTVIYPGGKSITEEKFAVLMLTPKKNATIQELLKEHFSQEEVLQGYTDDSGKTHHCAVLTQKISKFPPIFIVGFNMFRRKHSIQITEKMNTYKLFAACTHIGTMGGGHYIAHTKHRGTWYLKDDDTITKNAPLPKAGPFYFCLFKSTNS